MIRVGLRCDADAATGVGHLMRCLALAEELATRGVTVLLLGIVAVPWVRDEVRLPVHRPAWTPDGLARQALSLRLDAVVLDSYELAPGCGAALRAAGVAVLAIVDNEDPDQDADLYLNQNLGARLTVPNALSGVEYVLLRDRIRTLRPDSPPTPVSAAPVRVLGFFGGTDPFAAAPLVAGLLREAGPTCDATFVSAYPLPSGVTGIAATEELPKLITRADLVLSAAGTSLWELLCLGLPAALVCVADNQVGGYERAAAAGLAAPLGQLTSLQHLPSARATAVQTLRRLLASANERARLAAHGWAAVDGRGRVRVATALLALLAPATPHPSPRS